MAIRYPIEYELTPRTVDVGTRWLTLSLKNIGTEDLTSLDVRLNSLDVYNISTYGTGSYLELLESGGDALRLPFQIQAQATGSLYVTVDGWQDGEPFHWESPAVWVTVRGDVAELANLFAMTEPYPLRGQKLWFEATVRGLAESEGLRLEFWADTPSGAFEELATVETKELEADEEVRYSAEVTPEEEGLFTIYAYLYDGVRRIGRQVEYVYVRQA